VYDISTLSLPPENAHINGTVPEKAVELLIAAKPTLAFKTNIENMIDKTTNPFLGDDFCKQYVETA